MTDEHSKMMVYVYDPDHKEFRAFEVHFSPSEVRSFQDRADHLRTDPINKPDKTLDRVNCYLQVVGTYVIEEVLKSPNTVLVRVVVVIGEWVGATLQRSDYSIPESFLLEMEGLASDEVCAQGPAH